MVKYISIDKWNHIVTIHRPAIRDFHRWNISEITNSSRKRLFAIIKECDVIDPSPFSTSTNKEYQFPK